MPSPVPYQFQSYSFMSFIPYTIILPILLFSLSGAWQPWSLRWLLLSPAFKSFMWQTFPHHSLWAQKKIGWLTFTVLALGCLPPHLVIIAESSWRGEHATQGTAFLTGQPYQDSVGWSDFWERKRAPGQLCQIGIGPQYQNFIVKCCFVTVDCYPKMVKNML